MEDMIYAMGHTFSGRMTRAAKMITTSVHVVKEDRWYEAFGKAMTCAVHEGVAVIEIDSLSQVMQVTRSSGKSNLNQVMWKVWDDMQLQTVKHDLKQLWDAQTRTTQGSSDPLFDAMELHNERIRLGKKAIREMFHATPLNLNQQSTNGPIKAKDWE